VAVWVARGWCKRIGTRGCGPLGAGSRPVPLTRVVCTDMYPRRRCVVGLTERVAAKAGDTASKKRKSRGSVVERGKSLAIHLSATAGRRHRGLSNLQVASSILAGSSSSFQARMGESARHRVP